MKIIASALVFGLFAVPAVADPYGGKYTTCLDYYSVGPTSCSKPAPSVGQPPLLLPPTGQSAAAAQATTGATFSTPADDFLANYGKPPREFAEFYTNPTEENALKWVKTYNEMMKRSQVLGQQWSQADTLYQSQQSPAQRQITAPEEPFATTPPPTVQSTLGLAQAEEGAHIGAFEDQAGSQNDGFDSDEDAHITYYFSANCPFCARMTPQLLNIFNDMKGKLTLTCVDVTPISATLKPQQSNIIGKLPCAWRLPEVGEVEKENIHQTPTLLLSRSGKTFKRIEGYVPQVELQANLDAAPNPAR